MWPGPAAATCLLATVAMLGSTDLPSVAAAVCAFGGKEAVASAFKVAMKATETPVSPVVPTAVGSADDSNESESSEEPASKPTASSGIFTDDTAGDSSQATADSAESSLEDLSIDSTSDAPDDADQYDATEDPSDVEVRAAIGDTAIEAVAHLGKAVSELLAAITVSDTFNGTASAGLSSPAVTSTTEVTAVTAAMTTLLATAGVTTHRHVHRVTPQKRRGVRRKHKNRGAPGSAATRDHQSRHEEDGGLGDRKLNTRTAEEGADATTEGKTTTKVDEDERKQKPGRKSGEQLRADRGLAKTNGGTKKAKRKGSKKGSKKRSKNGEGLKKREDGKGGVDSDGDKDSQEKSNDEEDEDDEDAGNLVEETIDDTTNKGTEEDEEEEAVSIGTTTCEEDAEE